MATSSRISPGKLWISPIRARIIIIICLFTFISLALEGMIYVQTNVFDGVRAYTRGEGLWAKAQKDAVYYLTRYSYSHSHKDYQNFLLALHIPLGDKQARIALQLEQPDHESARIGFLKGGNDQRDVDAMINFFLLFQDIKYMREAIDIWHDADNKIDKLQQSAILLQNEITSSRPRTSRISLLREDVRKLNTELQLLENQFSNVLGDGARWVKSVTFTASIFALLLLISAGMFISYQIIKKITQTERRLLNSESRFRSLCQSNTIGIISWNIDGQITEANSVFLDMLGYDRNDLRNGCINWREFTPATHVDSDQLALLQLQEHDVCEPYEKEIVHKNGSKIPVYIGASLLEGDKTQGIAYVMDLSDRKRADEKQRLSAAVFETSQEGILITDNNLKIVSINNAFSEMTGYSANEIIGHTPRVLRSGYTSDQQYREMWHSLESVGTWRGDVLDRRKDGAILPLSLSISAVKDSVGSITHYTSIFSDISQRKQAEEHLRRLAHYDSLTGLPNRSLFNDRIEQALIRAERNRSMLAVLFFDLDKFKPVNDTFGHIIGDKLLQNVARQLTQYTRSSDTITRLGGDEFIILLEDVANRESVEEIARKTAKAITRPCLLDGHEISVGVSVGMSFYPDDGLDAKGLIEIADSAMYQQKSSTEGPGTNRTGQSAKSEAAG